MGRQRLGRGVFATWEILPQPTHTPRCRRSSSHPRCWLLRWLTSADLHIVIIVWNSEELWKTNEPGDHTRVLDVGCNFAMRDGRLGMQNGKERMNNRFSEGDASIRPHSWAGGRRARALTGSARRFLRSPAYACPVAGKQFARSYGWGSAKESTSAALATRNRPLLGKAATGQLGAPAANTERFVCHLLRAYSTLGRPTSTSTMVHRPLATSCSHHCISTSLRARPTHIGDLLSTRRYLPSRRTWSPLSCTAASAVQL